MLRKIKLYGKLAKFVGHRVLEAEVNNAAEAVRFLLANWPGLHKHMADQYYKVSSGDWEIGKNELHYPTGQDEAIKIAPVVGGAGGDTVKIIVGVALIGLALAAGPLGWGTLGSIGTFGSSTIAVTSVIGSVGVALTLSGIAGLLTPTPTTPEEVQDPMNSFSFSGIQNTSRAGSPLPIIFGEIITGSVVISAAIDTNQVEV
tara:strand:- start:3781 stop:4386 length:606 start_codon:yes stop_codon:yes gene_type:complete